MTKDSTKKEGSTLKTVDLDKPFYAVFHQTDARSSMELFQGPDAEAQAKARASQKAVKTKRRVVVLGPQIAAYDPPKAVEAQEVQLDWTL